MKKKILVVDDESDLVHLYRLVLELNGFHVRGATSGVQALSLIEQDPPHLVLLDVMMPGMNGIEVCRRIRARNDSQREPAIIMYTADDSAENRQASENAGADELISKEVPIEQVTDKINRYLLQESFA